MKNVAFDFGYFSSERMDGYPTEFLKMVVVNVKNSKKGERERGEIVVEMQ